MVQPPPKTGVVEQSRDLPAILLDLLNTALLNRRDTRREDNGEPGRDRTCDLLIKSQSLYQLSYGLQRACAGMGRQILRLSDGIARAVAVGRRAHYGRAPAWSSHHSTGSHLHIFSSSHLHIFLHNPSGPVIRPLATRGRDGGEGKPAAQSCPRLDSKKPADGMAGIATKIRHPRVSEWRRCFRPPISDPRSPASGHRSLFARSEPKTRAKIVSTCLV